MRGTLSADGALAAIATERGVVQLWDVASGQPLHVLLGHTAEVAELVFSPDAALLASCSADCSLRVWDTRTGANPLLSTTTVHCWLLSTSSWKRTLPVSVMI